MIPGRWISMGALALLLAGCGGGNSESTDEGVVATRDQLSHSWTVQKMAYGGTEYPCPYSVSAGGTGYQCSDPAEFGGTMARRQYGSDGTYTEQNGDVLITGTWTLSSSGKSITYNLMAGSFSYSLTETVMVISDTELVVKNTDGVSFRTTRAAPM